MFLKRFIYTIAACFGLSMTSLSSAETIVVVDSYIADYPWSATSRQGFNENIDPKHDVTYFEMDTKRISPSRFEQRANEVWDEIVSINPDIVVTMDDNSLKFLGERITNTGYPLVFMGVNNDPRLYFESGNLPVGISGVMERPLLFQSMLYISKVLPMKHNRILLVMDNGATSTGVYEKTLNGRDKISANGVDLDVFIATHFDEWQTKFRSLSSDDYDAVLVGSFSALQETDRPEVTDSYILEWASEHSPVPLFTFWSHRIGHGKTVGGLVISGYEQGKSAAMKVHSILDKEVYPLVEVSKIGEPIFSESQLSRWNIELPEFIRNRSQIVE